MSSDNGGGGGTGNDLSHSLSQLAELLPLLHSIWCFNEQRAFMSFDRFIGAVVCTMLFFAFFILCRFILSLKCIIALFSTVFFLKKKESDKSLPL